MTDVATLISDMVKAGVSAEIVGRVAAALAEKNVVAVQVKDEAAERRREKDRERKRNVRGNPQTSADSADTISSLDDKGPHTPKNTNLSSKENPPKGGQKKGSDEKAELGHVWPADAWERWYAEYPHKVGKGAAEAAFEKIRRSGKVPFDALMAGVESYRRTKPAHVDWCNPATWLNQARWEDAPAPSVQPAPQAAAKPAWVLEQEKMRRWL